MAQGKTRSRQAQAQPGANPSPHAPAGSAATNGASNGEELPAVKEGLYPPYTGSAAELPTAAGGGEAAAGAAGPDSEAALRALAADSPFIDLNHFIGLYEGAKLVLMLPVVVIKALVLGPIVVFFWAVLQLMLLGHKPQTALHPVRFFFVRNWTRLGARILLAFGGIYRIPVKGWDNYRRAKEARSILVFNHESYVDAPAMAGVFAPSGVAKSGMAVMPLIGAFAVALQFFFIERKGAQDEANPHVLRGEPIDAIRQRAADPRYPLVMMAPEATTKACRCLLKFRRGAFATGGPVSPVLITYRFKHFNPGWGICYTPLHFYRLMAQFVNHIELEVLPPIHPTPQEQRDPMLFAENVRRLMAEKMGAPLVEQGVAQMRELMQAGVEPDWRGARLSFPSDRKAAVTDGAAAAVAAAGASKKEE